MSTLDDLRAQLDQHADTLVDTGARTRPAAVHARVRVVRRRRVAVAAVAAVVVVAGAVGLQSLRPSGPLSPADRVVVGVQVPGSVSVLGFPYVAMQVDDLTDGDPLHVDADRVGVLVATGLGSGSVTLYVDDEPVARVRGDEERAVPVPLGSNDASVRVRFDGTPDGARAGIALYAATGDLPPGVSDATAVFRDEVAGQALVAAGFVRAGQHTLDLEVPATSGMLRYVVYCTGDADLFEHVEVDGAQRGEFGCGSDRDAGTGSSLGAEASGSAQRVRAYLTRGVDGPAVTTGDVVFGVGVYRWTPAPEEVLGNVVQPEVEHAGRTWVLEGVRDAPARIDTSDGDRFVMYVGGGDPASVAWRGRLDSGHSSVHVSPGPVSTNEVGVLLAGDVYDVTIPPGRGKLLVYRPQ